MRKSMMNMLGALLVVGLCSVSALAQTPPKETIVIGLKDDVASLDPAKSYENVSLGIAGYAYEGLVRFQEDDLTQFVPGLADSWEVGADGKTWTFHLRHGVTFSSGNPFNADAVVFSLNRALKLGAGPSWLLTQFGLNESSILKIDDYTVQMVLNQQYAPSIFLACLAGPVAVAYIVDPQVAMEHEQNGDLGSAWLEDHSAGTGRFVIIQRNRTNPVEYVLTANERYWGKPSGIREIRIKGIQDSEEQARLLELGEIDIAWNLDRTHIDQLLLTPGIEVAEFVQFAFYYVGMNLAYEPLSKPEVRDAIRYGIDYDGIINIVLQGAAEKIQTFIPKGFLGYNPAMPYTYDPEKAKQLLIDAGYPDGFDVELKGYDFSPRIEIAEKIKQDLAAIGIRVTVKPRSGEEMMAEAWSPAKNFQLHLSLWVADYLDPDSNAKGFAHSTSTGTDAPVQLLAWWCNYVNQETSQLVEQAAHETDRKKREELYATMTNAILDDGPVAILFSPFHQYALRSDVMPLLNIRPISWSIIPELK